MPKQLVRLLGEQSLLEQTARRLLARAATRADHHGRRQGPGFSGPARARADHARARPSPAARAARAQHRRGNRARRPLRPRADGAGCAALGLPLGPPDAGAGCAARRDRRRPAGGRGGRAADLRHHADPARDGLRLHPCGRAAPRRAGRPAGRALRREARAGGRRGDARRGRLFLEQRDASCSGRIGSWPSSLPMRRRSATRSSTLLPGSPRRRTEVRRCRRLATRRCRPSRSTRR